MAAILTSLWKLAENMGISIKKDTIEEQINAMNKALEQKQENNIANALWNYADASGGGGGGNTYDFKALAWTYTSGNFTYYGATVANPIDNDGTFDVVCHEANDTESGQDEGWGGPIILSAPAKRINYKEKQMSGEIAFTPAENFDGFYLNGTTKITTTGDEVTPGDGLVYLFKFDVRQSTHTIKQNGPNAAVVPFE